MMRPRMVAQRRCSSHCIQTSHFSLQTDTNLSVFIQTITYTNNHLQKDKHTKKKKIKTTKLFF